jgi:DNA polymerase III epsilon subunit-like protein
MSTPGAKTSAPVPAQLQAFWARLRIVVLDLETATGDDGIHAVEIGAVTCRNGRRTSSTWTARVNPGIPIDQRSRDFHGITDDDVIDEPPFPDVAPALTRRLTSIDGEQLVVAAYNATFDIGVLRSEYRRAGLDLPDVPVLDVMRLPQRLGIRPASGSLASLLAYFGIVNVAPHSAGGDSDATVTALLRLLELAAEQGHASIDEFLMRTAKGDVRTTLCIRAPKKGPTGPVPYTPKRALPVDHAARHQPRTQLRTHSDREALLADLLECAQLRCSHAPDRVLAAADISRTAALAVIDGALAQMAAAEQIDVPGVATIVGSALPHLGGLTRVQALAWHDKHHALLSTAGRCPTGPVADVCDACRDALPCPLDTWTHPLATSMFPPAASNKTLELTLRPPTQRTGTGRNKTGPGVWSSTRRGGRELLADHLAWLVTDELHRRGQVDLAAELSSHLHRRGCRDPRLVARVAGRSALPGTKGALERGIAVCDDALATRADSSDDGWQVLLSRRSQLLGRLARLRAAIDVDEDGNDIYKRRHHPEDPVRPPRVRRFSLRA